MTYLVEYSPLQRALHVDALDRILEINRKTIEQGVEPGFIPIYAAATHEEAQDLAEQWRKEHQEVLRL